MAPKRRSDGARGNVDRKNLSEDPIGKPEPEYRGHPFLPARSRAAYAALRRTSLVPGTPPALRNYSFAAGQVMSTVHCPAEDKVVFEELRAAARVALGFPVTQPGAFAAVVAFAAGRRGEFLAELSRSVGEEGVGEP